MGQALNTLATWPANNASTSIIFLALSCVVSGALLYVATSRAMTCMTNEKGKSHCSQADRDTLLHYLKGFQGWSYAAMTIGGLVVLAYFVTYSSGSGGVSSSPSMGI